MAQSMQSSSWENVPQNVPFFSTGCHFVAEKGEKERERKKESCCVRGRVDNRHRLSDKSKSYHRTSIKISPPSSFTPILFILELKLRNEKTQWDTRTKAWSGPNAFHNSINAHESIVAHKRPPTRLFIFLPCCWRSSKANGCSNVEVVCSCVCCLFVLHKMKSTKEDFAGEFCGFCVKENYKVRGSTWGFYMQHSAVRKYGPGHSRLTPQSRILVRIGTVYAAGQRARSEDLAGLALLQDLHK